MNVYQLMEFLGFTAAIFSFGFKIGILYTRKNRP